MKTKKCTSENGCGETKPVSEFGPYSTGSGTLKAMCSKCCAKESARNYKKKDPSTQKREFCAGIEAMKFLNRKIA